MKKKSLRAFTLIELLIVLALLSVLLTLAAPSFRDFYRSSQLSSQVNNLVAALQTAKNEAVKHNAYTYLVPNDGASWDSGWMVFVDTNFDGIFTQGQDIRIMQNEAFPGTLQVRATGSASGASPYVSFDGSGYPRTNSGTRLGLTFTVNVRDLTGSQAVQNTRNIKLAVTGRLRSCRPQSTSDSKCETPSYSSGS